MGDDHDDGIASIQRFLRGKVVSADSDASLSHDLSSSVTGKQPGSSADGTIIERSASLESDLQSATSDAHADQAEAVPAARDAEEGTHAATEEETRSNERWSQVSFGTGNVSSHHPSGYSLHSNSPKRDLHHEVRTPSFTYDAHLSSEPTTADTQLGSASADEEGLSVAGQVVKSYLSSSPSDETFFISSGPSGASIPHEQQQQDASAEGQPQPGERIAGGNREAEGQGHGEQRDGDAGAERSQGIATRREHARPEGKAILQRQAVREIPALRHRPQQEIGEWAEDGEGEQAEPDAARDPQPVDSPAAGGKRVTGIAHRAFSFMVCLR